MKILQVKKSEVEISEDDERSAFHALKLQSSRQLGLLLDQCSSSTSEPASEQVWQPSDNKLTSSERNCVPMEEEKEEDAMCLPVNAVRKALLMKIVNVYEQGLKDKAAYEV